MKIPFFDYFIDTCEKRYHLLLLLFEVSAILIVVPYIVLGFYLIILNDYSSLFAFIKKPIVEWTYISRIIVDAISITKLTFANIIACFINNIRSLEVIIGICFMLSYGILEKKRSTTICLGLMAFEIMFICGLAFLALNAGSLQSVILYIRYIGILILLVNGVLLMLLVYHLLRQGKYYRNALLFQSEEIKEHMET